MQKACAILWTDAPELAIPANPALFSNTENLWLAYETTADPRGEICAVLQFRDVIEHRLSPVNDEGLGQHPYAAAGLKFYAFHEILHSAEASRWQLLAARHWVVTFKDVTLDVVAKSLSIAIDRIQTPDPAAALLPVLWAIMPGTDEGVGPLP